MQVDIRTLRFGNFSVEYEKGSKVAWLKEEIAKRLKVRSAEQIVLVHKGRAILDKESISSVSEGSLLASVVPGQPSSSLRQMTDSQNAQSGVDDEEVTFRLPAGTSLWVARLARFLQKDLRFPEVFLIILFRVRRKVWLYIALWLVGARASSWLGVGPLFILATIAVLIFCNLGQRQAGEASAYSIFNNFQALPGQLTADQLDQQVRTGQM